MSRAQRRKRIQDTSIQLAEVATTKNASASTSTATDSWQTAIIICFHFFFLTVPLVFTWVNEELFEFNKIILTYACAVVIGGLWAGRMIAQKKLHLRRTIFDWPILLFLASQILATIFSMNIHTSIFGYYTRFNGGLLSTLAYILLFYAFVSNIPKNKLQPLFFTTFFSAFLVTLMAIPEHFGHAFTCLLINSSHNTGPDKIPWFSQKWWKDIFNVTCWIQDVQTRVFATFGQPNWLAAYAITLIPVGIVQSLPKIDLVSMNLEQVKTDIYDSLSKWILSVKPFYFVVTVMLFETLLFTKSRSGVVGLAVGLLFFLPVFLFLVLRKITANNQGTRALMLAVLGGFLITFTSIALYYGTPYTPNFGERFFQKHTAAASSATATSPATVFANSTVSGNSPVASETANSAAQAPAPTPAPTPPPVTGNSLEIGGTDSWIIRKIVWTGALKVWLRYPLFGSGVETFAYSYYKDRPAAHNLVSEWDFLYNKAHNEFLNYLATTGTVGFLAYCFMLAIFLGVPFIFIFDPGLTHFSFLKFLRPKAEKKLTKNLTFQENLATPENLFAIALISGIIALSISNFFGFSTVVVSMLLFILPAIFVIQSTPETWMSLGDSGADSHEASKIDDDEMLWLPSISFIFLFCIAAGLLFAIYAQWQSDYLFAHGKLLIQSGETVKGVQSLQEASQIEPNEGVFSDELASTYSRLAIAAAEGGDATSAGQLANQALQETDQTVQQNPTNLNFYKTKVRVLIDLSALQPSLLNQSEDTLKQAIELAPTDPKLRYFLAVVELELKEEDAGIADLQKAIALKPNYAAVRAALGDEYVKLGKITEAKEQYQYILDNLEPGDPTVTQKLKDLEKPPAPKK